MTGFEMERIYEPDLAREVSALLLLMSWRQIARSDQKEAAPSSNLEAAVSDGGTPVKNCPTLMLKDSASAVRDAP
jgi:hypothetical protein